MQLYHKISVLGSLLLYSKICQILCNIQEIDNLIKKAGEYSKILDKEAKERNERMKLQITRFNDAEKVAEVSMKKCNKMQSEWTQHFENLVKAGNSELESNGNIDAFSELRKEVASPFSKLVKNMVIELAKLDGYGGSFYKLKEFAVKDIVTKTKKYVEFHDQIKSKKNSNERAKEISKISKLKDNYLLALKKFVEKFEKMEKRLQKISKEYEKCGQSLQYLTQIENLIFKAETKEDLKIISKKMANPDDQTSLEHKLKYEL